MLSLGDHSLFGETHLAYDGGNLPPTATAGCGHVLDDWANGCQNGHRHRGRAVDPVADCLRCRLASVTDAALMLLRSRRCASSLSARLGSAWALFVDEMGLIHASETGAVVMIISRSRLGVIVCACMLANDRRTSTVSNSQGCGAASAVWSSPTGQGKTRRRQTKR